MDIFYSTIMGGTLKSTLRESLCQMQYTEIKSVDSGCVFAEWKTVLLNWITIESLYSQYTVTLPEVWNSLSHHQALDNFFKPYCVQRLLLFWHTACLCVVLSPAKSMEDLKRLLLLILGCAVQVTHTCSHTQAQPQSLTQTESVFQGGTGCGWDCWVKIHMQAINGLHTEITISILVLYCRKKMFRIGCHSWWLTSLEV